MSAPLPYNPSEHLFVETPVAMFALAAASVAASACYTHFQDKDKNTRVSRHVASIETVQKDINPHLSSPSHPSSNPGDSSTTASKTGIKRKRVEIQGRDDKSHKSPRLTEEDPRCDGVETPSPSTHASTPTIVADSATLVSPLSTDEDLDGDILEDLDGDALEEAEIHAIVNRAASPPPSPTPTAILPTPLPSTEQSSSQATDSPLALPCYIAPRIVTGSEFQAKMTALNTVFTACCTRGTISRKATLKELRDLLIRDLSGCQIAEVFTQRQWKRNWKGFSGIRQPTRLALLIEDEVDE